MRALRGERIDRETERTERETGTGTEGTGKETENVREGETKDTLGTGGRRGTHHYLMEYLKHALIFIIYR